MYGLYSEKTGGYLSNFEYTLYNGFARLGWGIALSWVIFSCSKGYGGMINDFLSWKFFLPLSRLSFMTYLIHAMVVFTTVNYFNTMETLYSLQFLVGIYLANLMLAMTLALILTLVFESPFIKLEKLIIGAMLGQGRNEKKKPI